MRKLMILVLAALMTGLTVLPALAVDTTFHDGFASATLNAGKWTKLAGDEPAQIDSGQDDAGLKVLRLTEASGTEGKIKSNVTFTEGTFCLAKVKLADVDQQRFGFDPRGEITGMGAYFLGNDEDTVRAVVTDVLGANLVTFSKPIEITPDVYHIYKIFWERDTGFVKFFIDGELVATYDGVADLAFYTVGTFIPFTDTAKPLVLWSSLAGDTKFDWVFVTPTEVNLTYTDLTSIGTDLGTLDIFALFPGDTDPPLATTQVTSFTQQGGFLVGSSVHTSSIENQWVALFFLNEGGDVTFVPGGKVSFSPNNPKFGADVDFSGSLFGGLAPGDSELKAVHLTNISPKFNKKGGGGLLNFHIEWLYDRDEEDIAVFTDILVRTSTFPKP